MSELKIIRVVELFSAIGGFRLGLEKCSTAKQRKGFQGVGNTTRGCGKQFNRGADRQFNCVWANDNDKYACRIYRSHWNDGTLHEGDIRAVDPNSIPDHDLLCAGFPCQSFSIAGKRRGFEDTRGTLFFEICRIAKAKRTPILFLENVKGLLNHEGGQTFQKILSSLDELGYDCQWQVLNSKNFGVPQNRERVFIIGHLRGTSRPEVFPIEEGFRLDTQTQRKNREKIQTYRCLEGTEYKGYSSERFDGVLQDVGIRRLTPTECERLQGFPDSWTEGVSDTQRYKCLGNAVTVNVIESIGLLLGKNIS